MNAFDVASAVRRALDDLAPLAGRAPALAGLAQALGDPHSPDRALRRLLRLAGIALDRAYIGPAVVHLDIVGVCNLNCIYCRDHSPYLTGRERWRNMEMPVYRLKRVVREGLDLGAELFPLLGSGEPRMHSAWDEIVEFMIGSDVDFEIFTNGLLLDERDAAVLAVARRLKLYFSISAATERTYKAFRPEMGGELLPRIERTIMAISRRRERAAGPRLVIVHVLNALNVHELPQMVEQAVRTGADEVQLKLTEYEPFNRPIMLSAAQIENFRAALPQFKADLAVHGVTVHDNIDAQLAGIEAASGLFSAELYKRIGCYIGYDLVRVRRDGRIALCCAQKWVGDLNRDTLAGHFHGDDMRALRWAAKRCFAGWNARLRDGSALHAADCKRCFNYISNLHMQAELEALGLWELIREDARALGPGRELPLDGPLPERSAEVGR